MGKADMPTLDASVRCAARTTSSLAERSDLHEQRRLHVSDVSFRPRRRSLRA